MLTKRSTWRNACQQRKYTQLTEPVPAHLIEADPNGRYTLRPGVGPDGRVQLGIAGGDPLVAWLAQRLPGLTPAQLRRAAYTLRGEHKQRLLEARHGRSGHSDPPPVRRYTSADLDAAIEMMKREGWDKER